MKFKTNVEIPKTDMENFISKNILEMTKEIEKARKYLEHVISVRKMNREILKKIEGK